MRCCCCGSRRLELETVLWPELIAEWRLADREVAYIDRQQGLRCATCRCNLRSMALARAVMTCFGFAGLFKDFTREGALPSLHLLEINEAGGLTQFLVQMPGHVLRSYPDVDMRSLPYPDATFDLVLHSDTLEHVEHPVRALSECARVLKPGGFCAWTVPIVVDRLTTTRSGLPPSYHGSRDNPADCLVFTEYGADAWKHAVEAGFRECRLFSLEYPAALALVGVKDTDLPPEEDCDAADEGDPLRLAAKELAALIPPEKAFILVDDNQLGNEWAGGRRAIPFLERDGEYWGKPPDAETAVRELERLREAGADYIVFTWPAFWWRSCYPGLQHHLRSRFRCLLENDRLLVFDLRAST